MNRTKLKDLVLTGTEERGLLINVLIDEFEPVNPSCYRLFANKTQRAALERLIDKHGFEKIRHSIQYACSVAGQEFAPIITTPVQLETKLGQLIIFYKRKHNSEQKNSFIT